VGERDLFVGLDAGSSVCKAAVFDPDGRALAVAAEPTPLDRSRPGRVEADPDRCWQAATSVLRRAVAAAGGGDRIAGLGVTGAMVGAWVVDDAGRTLRPGINWEDSRARDLVAGIEAQRPGSLRAIFRSSGSALQHGCTLPVLAWLLRHEPEVMARARWVLGYKDWLRLRLTGEVAADPSEAAVAPGCARTQARSAAMLRLFGLEDAEGLLPPVMPSAAVAGGLAPDAAADTGLPVGLPVATGAGDVIANVIGAGGLRTGAVTALLGTTCMVGLCHDHPVFEPPDLGLLFSLPEGRWFRAMVNVAGTLNLDWAVQLLAPDLAGAPDLWKRVTALAAAEPVGARGLTYLPYLSESGIIAPVVDPDARAQFAGLAPGHDRASLLRAVYEGVAFALADLCDVLGPPGQSAITLTGGGGRSALWCDMIAEATGREVIVPQGTEFGARGAALLAAVALGRAPSVAAASAALLVDGRRHAPSGREAAWAEARALYRERRDRLLGRGPDARGA
jgi:sugar (pentulose or hexulose) kinase